MKNSRIIPLIFGFFIVYIGVIILLNSLGIHVGGDSIFPILLILLGYFLWKKEKKVLAYLFIIFGLLMLFNIDIGDIIGLLIAVAFIYYGYRLIRKKQREDLHFGPKNSNAETIFQGQRVDADNISNTSMREQQNREQTAQDINQTDQLFEEENVTDKRFTEHNWTDQQAQEQKQGNQSFYEQPSDATKSYRIITPSKRHSLIGNCYLTDSRWELKDMDIWYGIGEVKIDLSHANILEQKSTILINGWISDVDIYVPYDLEVAIIARVGVGEIEIFGNKEGGLNQTTTIETSGYRTAIKRVEIVINLFIGDIDVTYL